MTKIFPIFILLSLFSLSALAYPIKGFFEYSDDFKVILLTDYAAEELYDSLKVKIQDTYNNGTVFTKVGSGFSCKLDARNNKKEYSCRVVVWSNGDTTPGFASIGPVPRPNRCTE